MECFHDYGIKNAESGKLKLVSISNIIEVNYIEGIKGYPVVGNVKSTYKGSVTWKGVKHPFEISSIFFLVDYPFDFGSSKTNLKKDDILLKEIGKMKYEPEFWRDNPVIKRTPIEDEIINWFENKDIFGNFNPNEP